MVNLDPAAEYFDYPMMAGTLAHLQKLFNGVYEVLYDLCGQCNVAVYLHHQLVD